MIKYFMTILSFQTLRSIMMGKFHITMQLLMTQMFPWVDKWKNIGIWIMKYLFW